MKDEDLPGLTADKLEWLLLPGMAQALPELLKQAKHANETTLETISKLADAEKASRIKSAVNRRIRDARFPEINTVDGFDFEFDVARGKLRNRYLALHDLAFLESGINPLFIGNPGTGKTFLARALAYKACTATRRVVFTPAAKMLNELHGAELHGRIERVLRKYTHAEL
jgi:DNA replication protein DnaC